MLSMYTTPCAFRTNRTFHELGVFFQVQTCGMRCCRDTPGLCGVFLLTNNACRALSLKHSTRYQQAAATSEAYVCSTVVRFRQVIDNFTEAQRSCGHKRRFTAGAIYTRGIYTWMRTYCPVSMHCCPLMSMPAGGLAQTI